ncbi:MAG: FHA domain-containing protein [Chloroflexi bacterium]|nr:FHA domain-containing protein [Chloroflexota bacterium]MBU1747285.1 FHA domain-containing protein [Chloroflexota bacterium]MBU1879590.1 FHA domain-containing protein [Chloroflexota bacterium]
MSAYRSPSAFLVIQAGGSVGKEFPFNKDTITIGRSLDNDVILDDEQVSRHHANIRRQGDQYVLTDLASANGTYVDRRRISEPHVLRPGDMIQTGSLVLEFLSSAPDAATVIGTPGAEQTVVTAPPAPRYAPPPPQPAYAAPPPPPPAYVPPPVVAPTRPAKKKGGMGGWCGCLVVITIVLISLVVLAVAGYLFAIMFSVLPDSFGILPMLGLQPGSLM